MADQARRSVKRGDIVAVVETQKGAIEIEIFESGADRANPGRVGGKVPVGTPLARIRFEHEAEVAPGRGARCSKYQRRARSASRQRAQVPPAPTAANRRVGRARRRVRASPAARRLARRVASILRNYGQRSRRRDHSVPTLSAASRETAPRERKRAVGLDLDAMRTAIAAAMARSKREIPHYYLEHQVDVHRCEEFLARINAARPAG